MSAHCPHGRTRTDTDKRHGLPTVRGMAVPAMGFHGRDARATHALSTPSTLSMLSTLSTLSMAQRENPCFDS